MRGLRRNDAPAPAEWAMEELLKDFLAETSEQLEAIGAQLVRFELDPSDTRILANIFRVVHAIKGTCGFLNLPRLEQIAHAAETLIEALRDGSQPTPASVTMVLAAIDRIKFILAELALGNGEPTGDDAKLIGEIAALNSRAARNSGARQAMVVWESGFTPGPTPPERRADTVRISLRTLEQMTALVSELALAQNQLAEAARSETSGTLRKAVQRLAGVAADLRLNVFAARMQPVDRLFVNLHRLVRDLCPKVGKKAELVLEGGGVELDRQLIEAIRDPLTHMIRNAVDHGLETPAERRQAGKPEMGLVRITASRVAGEATIVVADDGRGVDEALIRERVVALGLETLDSVARLSEPELLRYLFWPNFSTASRVSEISGRGVGLDIVRSNIEAVGGSVALTSRRGLGVEVTLCVPLTLAITPTLVLSCRGERYLVPQHAVDAIEEAGGGGAIEAMADALRWRSGAQSWPAARLATLVGLSEGGGSGAEIALRLRVGSERYVLLVDDVIDVQEVVHKDIPSGIPRLPLFAGAAILSDGRVALALDASAIGIRIGASPAGVANVVSDREPLLLEAKFKMLVFRSASGTPRALPLQTVASVDTVLASEIVVADGVSFVRRGGRLIPIVESTTSDLAGSLTLVVLSEGERCVALPAEGAADTIEEDIRLEFPGHGHGVLGVATIAGAPTEILDAFQLIDLGPQRKRQYPMLDRRPHVLLIEPSAMAGEMLVRAMRGWGCRVAWTLTAREGLALATRERNIDVALIGLDIATLDQSDLPRRLLAAQQERPPATYGLTSELGENARARARKSGLIEVLDRFDRASIYAALASAPDDVIVAGEAA